LGIELYFIVRLLKEMPYNNEYFLRFFVWGIDCGPCALWIMSIACWPIFCFIALFHKELLITTFDPTLATIIGFCPELFYYALMV
jgi:manganese/zinc/iron transport system permease protein